MSMAQRTPFNLSLAAKGAFAGLAGTAALTVAMKVGAGLLMQRGLLPEPRAPVRPDPAEQPTGKMARTIGDQLGASLDSQSTLLAGQAIHWTYGTGWGVFYATLQNRLQWPPLIAGVALGNLAGMVGSTVVPALGLAPSPSNSRSPSVPS